MIRVAFVPPSDDPAWAAWTDRCAITQRDHNQKCERGEVSKVTPLYSQAKSTFLAAFQGKCGYCESEITADQHGSVDHYRPKKGVTENGKPVVSSDGSRTHVGYYWLAYDWRNLRPSCVLCNEPNKQLTAGKLCGKRNEFPVRGARAWSPGEENQEAPLLLDPCQAADFDIHLQFEESGLVRPLTDEGRTTVELLGLNLREALVKARARSYKHGKDAAFFYALACLQRSPEHAQRQRAIIDGFRAGSVPYAAAGRAGIKAGIDEFDRMCLTIRADFGQ